MNGNLWLSGTLAAALLLYQSNPVFAQDAGDVTRRIEALEAEIALLKRQTEVREEKQKAAAEKQANTELSSKGLKITSPDKRTELSLRGTVQLDARHFINDDASTGRDEALARRIRPVLEIKAGSASARIMPDFAGSATRIFDAHVDYKFTEAVQFRFGKFKPPIGLERLQSAADLTFVERGHPTNLAPTRDIGLMAYGNVIPDVLEYQFGIFNGNADLANTDSDDDDKKDVVARVFVHPFRNSGTVALRGFGAGLAGSIGDREGAVTRTILGTYRSPGQQDFFRYRGDAFADGRHWRLYPQAYWYLGSLGVMAEYAISNQNVTRGANHASLEHEAWQLAANYVLTGEDASFRGGVKPAQNFGPDGVGAWEITARIGRTELDKDTFPLFSDPAVAASQAESFGGGLSWYLNENLKLMVNYDFTEFQRGARAGGDRADEHALFSRAQFRF